MNEVLRRKLFNKVMNANQPAGILASSPEMVETVQRRAHGGYHAPTSNILSNALRSVRGLPAIRQAGDTSGAGKPDLTGLTYEQQVKAMQEAGYGATIGTGPIQPVLDAAQSINQGVVDVVKGIGSFGQKATDALGNQLSIAGKRAAEDLDFMGNARRARQQSRINKQIDTALLAEDDDQESMTTIGIPAPLGDDNVDDDYIGGVGKGILSNQLPEGQVDEFGNLLGGIDGRSVPTRPAAVPVIAAAEKEVAESNEPQATASNISTTFDKLTANLNSILGGGKATEKINPQQAAKPSTHAALAAKIAEGPTAVEDVDLDKIEELVSETTGFDPEKSGEAKKGAFWNAVITAGLSIAAGESENNLTNIAKGLGFAFNQYGKAVGKLTDQDRADQKEARVLRLSLIKDEKTANIAKAAKQDQYNQQVFQNDLALKQDGDIVAHRERQNDINVAQIYANAEIKMMEAVNTKKYRDGDLDIKRQTLDDARDKAFREAQPDHVQSLLAVGHAKMVDGTPKLLPEYEEVYGPNFIPEIIRLSALAGSKGGNKLTDTDDLTAAYNQQYSFLSPAQARILAEQTKSGNLENFGSVNNAIQELFGIPIENQQSGGGQGSIPEYNTQPSDEELGKLLQSGVTQIKIGGKTYPIQKN